MPRKLRAIARHIVLAGGVGQVSEPSQASQSHVQAQPQPQPQSNKKKRAEEDLESGQEPDQQYFSFELPDEWEADTVASYIVWSRDVRLRF